MPRMSHCVTRSDDAPAGDIGRLEIGHSQAFSAVNASLDHLGDRQARLVPAKRIVITRTRLFECAVLTNQSGVWIPKAPPISSGV
jgi:hypothetical protein